MPSPPPPNTNTVRVSVDEMRFFPAHVVITKGTSVRWEPVSGCSVAHCLEVVDAEETNFAMSPAMVPGTPWDFEFTEVGNFHYRSLIYCFMKGTVTVVEAVDVLPTPKRSSTSRVSQRSSAWTGASSEDGEPTSKELHGVLVAQRDASTDHGAADKLVSLQYTRLASDETVEEEKNTSYELDPKKPKSTVSSSGNSRNDYAKDDARVPKSHHPLDQLIRAAAETSRRFLETSSSVSTTERTYTKCDRCSLTFVSETNRQRHRVSCEKRRGTRGKPPVVALDEVVKFWTQLPSAARRDVCLVSQPGEAGALVAAGFKGRTATRVEQQENDQSFLKYKQAGSTLAIAAGVFDEKYADETQIATETATLFACLREASEGTCFGRHTNLDLPTMILDENLEAALAFLLEQRISERYLDERSVEAEFARKTLLLEIDETAAETERRDAHRGARNKAKKAKARTKRRGDSTLSGASGVSENETGGEEIMEAEEDETTETSKLLELERVKRDSDLDAAAAKEHAELEAHTASAASAKSESRPRRGLDFRGDSAKGAGATPVLPARPTDDAVEKKTTSTKKLPPRPATAPVSPLREGFTIPTPKKQSPESANKTPVVVKPLSRVKELPVVPVQSGIIENLDSAVVKKSRRNKKLERRAGGGISDVATTDISASGSDVGYRTASDTELLFGTGPSGSVTTKQSRRARVAARANDANGTGGETLSLLEMLTGNAALPPPILFVALVSETPTATTYGYTYQACATHYALALEYHSATDPGRGVCLARLVFVHRARHSDRAVVDAGEDLRFAGNGRWSANRDAVPKSRSADGYARAAMAHHPFPTGGVPMMSTTPHPAPPIAHQAHMLNAAPPVPAGIDPEVYMRHYMSALAAIQKTHAEHSWVVFAPPLPPGPPPQMFWQYS
eukprot:CAMPEP_0117631084 /NCGR_PEP_ID=MMETSP0802-20121206/3842_1 /TAXON_ID=38833 /ORGANISM="Micromonas sp., Strain CCMP2099" /LENGTH=910 /DNA_ID=CAMNT_0005435401 /DNA_START=84 /DNA_END=2816 /DNA_ORIENTATION=+